MKYYGENKVKYRLLNICDMYKCKLYNKILENVELICLYIKYLDKIIGTFQNLRMLYEIQYNGITEGLKIFILL